MKFDVKKKFFISIFLFALLLVGNKAVAVEDPCLSKSGQDKIDCYDDLVNKYSSQAKTLANQIAQYDTQIKLTTLKIKNTQEKIELLGGRIDQLEDSLNSLTKAFSERAVETYKLSKVEYGFLYIISAEDLSGAVSRFHYLQRIQEADRSLLTRLEEAQTTYEGEKIDQEELQKELEAQKKLLDNQKRDKANLLAVTKNNENIFAQLRDEAAAELAVVSGLGKETFLRDVNTGDVIGNIISGRSGCSSGRHLHFEVQQGNSVADPNNFLSSTSFSYSYSDMGYYGSINPHGSWPWPIAQPIEINQGFGATGFAKDVYKTKFHQGIDMDSGSSTQVKAVQPGKLYGGSYTCKGTWAGTLLYAKVEQNDGIKTWYLHMIPQ